MFIKKVRARYATVPASLTIPDEIGDVVGRGFLGPKFLFHGREFLRSTWN